MQLMYPTICGVRELISSRPIARISRRGFVGVSAGGGCKGGGGGGGGGSWFVTKHVLLLVGRGG